MLAVRARREAGDHRQRTQLDRHRERGAAAVVTRKVREDRAGLEEAIAGVGIDEERHPLLAGECRDDGIDHFYSEYFQTINFEYDLCERIMLFNEFILVSPSGSLAAGCQYYEHAGIHLFLMPNLQLDFHAAVGLNQYSDDFLGGSGLSWRW